MAWTAPRTWVTTEVITASILNTHVRDNLLMTAPAVATAGARLIVTTGANTLTERLPTRSTVNTSETTASTSYTDLATSGPAVTTTTADRALILLSARIFTNTAGSAGFMGYAVSGSSTISATDNVALSFTSSDVSEHMQGSYGWIETGLSPGSNTFTAKYHVSANTGTFSRRTISAIPF